MKRTFAFFPFSPLRLIRCFPRTHQLGLGAASIARSPVRLDALPCERPSAAVAVSAAKYHSAALLSSGELLTWGYGRGGRLGHGDLAPHSAAADAVLTPRPVAGPLERRRVTAVSAGKHHTVAIVEPGEVW